MKYLLVLLVVAIAIGIWRGKRRVPDSSQASRKPAALNKPQTMVECAHCGLHLPQADAISGAQSQFFCSAEHRRLCSQSSAAR